MSLITYARINQPSTTTTATTLPSTARRSAALSSSIGLLRDRPICRRSWRQQRAVPGQLRPHRPAPKVVVAAHEPDEIGRFQQTPHESGTVTTGRVLVFLFVCSLFVFRFSVCNSLGAVLTFVRSTDAAFGVFHAAEPVSFQCFHV